jgi:hypothetical protein
MDPRIILIALAIYGVVWIGGESVKGLRWVKHHTKSAIHHIVDKVK